MGNTNCGDCMSEEAGNGERRSWVPEDRMLDQLDRKSDAARYAINFPYRPAPENRPVPAVPADRDPRPTLNLEGDPGLFAPQTPNPHKLDLSISLSDIRQVRDSVPLSELRALQHAEDPDSPVHSLRPSRRRPEPYSHAYQVPDYFERPQAAPYQRQASKKPAYLQEQKENYLFVPAARQRDSAETAQIGRQKPQHYYY